jgi:hypothetical protein
MKKAFVLIIILLSSAAGLTSIAHASVHHHTVPARGERPALFVNFKNVNMKNSLTVIATIILAMLMFQATLAQGSYSRPTQQQLDDISEVKKEVDDGKITKANWETSGRFQRGIISQALISEQRKNLIENTTSDAAERKALNSAYDGLVKSLSKQGISHDEPMDEVLKFLYAQLESTIQSVKEFKTTDRFMVSGPEKDWLLRAISKKEYDKWIADSKIDWSTFPPINKKKFDEGFSTLKASAAKQIPTFKPSSKNFTNENAADIAMIKKQIDAKSVSIHRIGLAQQDWDIQKSELQVPEKKYKVGYVWGKDSRDDFSYCRLYQVNIIQDYEGGGKYGKSYAVLLDSWVVGCP